MKKFLAKIPIVHTLKHYNKRSFRFDLVAGVTVSAVAIPQAMAYSQLVGAPLATGMYAAFAAMLVFAVFSTTRRVIVGPDAAMAALTGAVLLPFAAMVTPSEYASLVAFLAILIGLAGFVAYAGKLSFLSEFISRPILLGYMAGLALAVIASQLPKLFGLAPMPKANFFESIFYTLLHLAETNLPTLLLSIFVGLLCYWLMKYHPTLPMALIVLVLGIAVSTLFDLGSHGIAVVGAVPAGLPAPAIPRLSLFELQNLIIPAFALMAISYANTITTARSFAAKKNDSIDSSQELLALGMSNIGSGLFSGMPVAASGARTAVNDQTKAASQVSQLIGAAAIAVVLLFFTPILQYLPVAVLAVIIIFAIWQLFDTVELRSIWVAWHSEAILAIITVLGVTLLGIFQGLLLAVFLAIANLVRKSAFPTDAVLGVAANGAIRDMSRPPKTEAVPGVIMYRFDAPLYFGNSNFFRQRVLQLVDESPDVKWFIWDAETITSIDSTAGAMLPQVIHELRSKDVHFVVARMKGPVRHTIHASAGLARAFRNVTFYVSIGKALSEIQVLQQEKHAE